MRLRVLLLPFVVALGGASVPVESAYAVRDNTTHVVVIDGMQFEPKSLRVKTGDTVEWVNKDVVPHTATSEKNKVFDSRNLEPGASWKYVAKKKGTFPYLCTYHPTMKATLIVETAK